MPASAKNKGGFFMAGEANSPFASPPNSISCRKQIGVVMRRETGIALRIQSAMALVMLGILAACTSTNKRESHHVENWKARAIEHALPDSAVIGITYLSIYSEIYSQTEHLTHRLTATVSMRNINTKDTIYIKKATYYNTHGAAIRSYFENPIYIAPMETVEIVIDETDIEGGTGANFLFDWFVPAGAHEPFFEGVMISTSGQQGLSFTTNGRRVK